MVVPECAAVRQQARRRPSAPSHVVTKQTPLQSHCGIASRATVSKKSSASPSLPWAVLSGGNSTSLCPTNNTSKLYSHVCNWDLSPCSHLC